MSNEKEVVKMSSKGRVVIPKSVREDLGGEPEMWFVESTGEGGVLFTPAEVKPARE